MKKLARNRADTQYAYNLGVNDEALSDYVWLSKEHLEALKHDCYINSVGFAYACKVIYKLHDLGHSLKNAYDIVYNNIGAFNTNYVRNTMQGAYEIRNNYYHCSYFYLSLEQAKKRFRDDVFNKLHFACRG